MIRINKILDRFVNAPAGIIPLIRFRILFGALMLFGAIRFIQNGWIEKLYLEPNYFFKFYGLEWAHPFDEKGMYILMSIIILSATMVMLGFLYRIAIITFFVSFTYLEIMDATNYLNHYYLVCLLAFLMIFLPAHKSHSVDVLLWKKIKTDRVPSWTINILIFQLTVVYTCAGIAKLNYDWLFQAMPLAIWLPEHQDLPILGYFFQFKWMAYLMSWGGAFYDLTIAYFLMFKKTRNWAYAMVVIFHLLTWMLFNIGLFPLIMIVSTLIFFPTSPRPLKGRVNAPALLNIEYRTRNKEFRSVTSNRKSTLFDTLRNSLFLVRYSIFKRAMSVCLIALWIFIQIIIPFRHFLYPGDVLWTEEGYRFSWRVMLVEKSGSAVFTLKDPKTNRQTEITNSRYLTTFQEKQMSIQPDFILQYAHYLKYEYQRTHGIENPIITVDAHVALNGKVSQRFIDPTVNLAEIKDDFFPKKWILHLAK